LIKWCGESVPNAQEISQYLNRVESVMSVMSEDELRKIVDKALEGTPIKEPIIGDITYQINGVDVEPPVHFKVEPITPSQRKYSFSFTTPVDKSFYWNAAKLAEAEREYALDVRSYYSNYIHTDCRINKMDTKLKRLLR
jgi:hypothetical protein